jgi:polysaccharide pyruvyl transferase WcaK-like protein
MKICLCGYYGMGNFGDELFLETFKQIFAGHEVFGWSPYLDPASIDAVIIGGGDLITPYHFNSFYFPPALKHLPTWVYGVGIVDAYPPETWPEAEIAKYRERLSGIRGFCVRDQRSAGYGRMLKLHDRIETVPDPVFAYREPGIPLRRFSSRPVIGLCLFSYPSFPLEKMARILAGLIQEGYHLVLLPVVNQPNNAYADLAMCQKLRQKIGELAPGASITLPSGQYNLETTYRYVTNVDYLISFKLHPSLAALRSGVPVFCLSQMSKVRSLLQLFDLEEYFCNYDDDGAAIGRRLRDFLTHGKKRVDLASPLVRLVEKQSRDSLLLLKKQIEALVSG